MINPNRSTLTRRLFVSTLKMCCALVMIGTGALCWDSLVAVKAKSPSHALSLPATGSITANPNPIQVCDGTGLGITTLSWTSTGTSIVEVHLDEPNGMLLASSGPSDTVTTGKWVGNATQFFLQDVSGGLPLSSENTLATVTVYLAGCSSPGDQWATSGNNINNTNTGNVGVGTANPNFKLDVNGEINATGVRINGAPISSGGPGGAVSSVFGRTGAVVQQNNDYTWAQINKTSSSLADLQTRSAGDLNAGTVPIGRLGTSGIPDATTFLRGDNTWATVPGGPSPWATSGTNVYYNSGNVGIGTTTPNRKLELVQDVGGLSFEAGSGSPNSGVIRFGDNTGWKFHFGRSRNSVGGALNSGTSGVLMTIQDDGNVGVGTTTPSYRLDVAGQIRSSSGGFVFPDGTVQITAGGNGAVNSVFGRTGVVVAATNDYTWAQINKTTSSLADLTTRSASDLSSGTLPDQRFPAILPAVSGANLTALNASNLASGTVPLARLGSGAADSTKFLRGDNTWAVPSGSQWTTSNPDIYYNTGNVGIGTTSPQAKLDVQGNVSVTGNISATGNITAKYQDVAEWVPATHALPAGTVVALNPAQSNQVTASSTAYDTRVAGVVSERPGLALGEAGKDKVLVATTGRVKVKVDASRAPIRIGDLLVTSDMEGVAMKSVPLDLGGTPIHRPGTLIGKALEPLEKGVGEILVLLSLQ
jgi:hypothetical protein